MSKVKKLIVLADKIDNKMNKEYGGKGKFELPPSHKAGIIVPKGGSCCANCKYVEIKEDGPHCNSKYWGQWNGGDTRLPVDDPETYCSDWWEPKN